MMLYMNILSTLLLTLLCSDVSTSVPIGDDKSNWQALWKVLNVDGSTRTEDQNLTIFDKILITNARERARAQNGDGIFLYQGDIRMTRNEAIRLSSGAGHRSTRAVMKNFGRNRWPRNGLVYELHSSLNSRARQAIRTAIEEWEKVLPCMGKWKNIRNLRVRPKDYMQFYAGTGCNSQVGRVGGLQRISLGRGCETHGVVVHEIGHAMGMWHEQSRPDRDKFVTILWNNIIPSFRFAFRKISQYRINSYGVGYDYESVMHYSSNAFAVRYGLRTIQSRNGRRRLDNRRGMTTKDKTQAKLMYGCTETVKPQACSDNSTNCSAWKRNGFCRPASRYHIYMKKNCCKTCKVIDGPMTSQHDCSGKDKYKNCQSWSRGGYCTSRKYRKFMLNNCKMSCAC